MRCRDTESALQFFRIRRDTKAHVEDLRPVLCTEVNGPDDIRQGARPIRSKRLQRHNPHRRSYEVDDAADHRAMSECDGLLVGYRSEEHTSELQSLTNLVCRLL